MDQQHLGELLKQKQQHSGYSVSNENIVLMPYVCETGAQVAAVFATTVTNTFKERATVILGYASTRRSEADRNPEADHYFLQLENGFLEGSMPRERAMSQSLSAAARNWQPMYPVHERFATLKAEQARTGRLLAELAVQLKREGDLLAASVKLHEVQAILGVMALRASNLPQTRAMNDVASDKAAAQVVAELMMQNFSKYPGTTVAPFMSTKSQPLISHSCVQHALWTLDSTRILVELKRRYRQAQTYLNNPVC